MDMLQLYEQNLWWEDKGLIEKDYDITEKSEARGLNQLKKFVIITKKDYSKNPLKIPLAVFISLFDV